MGRRGGKRGGTGRGKQQNQRRTRPDIREEVPKTNFQFEKYYGNLDLFQDGERQEFWNTLRQDLPNSFRFTGSKGQALPVQQLLKDRYIPEITSIEYHGAPVDPPKPIPWYPDQLAWQMTTSKTIIRKFPPFAAFQRYLVSETNVGNISRQEAVSMIPPLLMDLRPSMTVLDMCAAPGSKAAQLIEMLHGGEEARMREVAGRLNRDQGREPSPEGGALGDEKQEEEQSGDWTDDGRTTGLLIANDNDYRRAHMLTHQMKRLNSPNLIVTNHDATMYPSIRLPSTSGPNKYLKFDRILADVPCSGDGTCRKNVNVWKDWVPGNALGLYFTQQRILVRALQMLKVGGRVVYSTCSMNPVENEAVIASAIDRCGGLSNVEVVDCSDTLPGLKRKSGLLDWKVMDKSGNIWSSWCDLDEHLSMQSDERLGKLVEGMFPPSDQTIPLHRCMRVYPHMQDTGGFFITVLEKKSEIKARPESQPQQTNQPSPSIVNAVNEIEKLPNTNGSNPTEKIDALDSNTLPSIGKDAEGVTAVARQNKESAPSTSVGRHKHSADAEADVVMPSKRLKVREEVEDPAPEGAEDRQIHWPPPPGADLDASRPKTTNTWSLPPPHYDGASGKKGAGNDTSTLRHTDAQLAKKRNQPYEEPFQYISPDHPDLETISSFYALSPRFPRDRFMVRNAFGTPTKTIYYTSALARDILITNANTGIKFVHCGVKMFVRQDVQSPEVCRWRIQNEGLPLLEAWVGPARTVKLYRRSTLRSLLIEMFPKIEGSGWDKLGEIAERVRDTSMGCCVLRVEKSDDRDGFKERMTLPLWRSLHSLNLMLPKEERSAMLLRLFDETTPLQDHSKKRVNRQEQNQGGGAGRRASADPINEEGPKEDDMIIQTGERDAEAEAEARQEMGGRADGEESDIAPKELDGQDVDISTDDDEGGGVPLKEEDVESKAVSRTDAI